MTEWHGKRPLDSGAGRELAAEVLDNPAGAVTLVSGALEAMASCEKRKAPADAQEDTELRVVYLRGLAAAAIVADVACAERRFTSALDFALGGDAVCFLRTDEVTLGLIATVLGSMATGRWVFHMLAESPHGAPPPKGHGLVVEMVVQMLMQAARVRLALSRGHEG